RSACRPREATVHVSARPETARRLLSRTTDAVSPHLPQTARACVSLRLGRAPHPVRGGGSDHRHRTAPALLRQNVSRSRAGVVPGMAITSRDISSLPGNLRPSFVTDPAPPCGLAD